MIARCAKHIVAARKRHCACPVQLLPRVDQLWYKYIHMEEMLGNIGGARQIFERWMKWEPDHHGWTAYIKARRSAPAAATCLSPYEACVYVASDVSSPACYI